MDLWQLKVFCNVVDSQSFSKAGQRIHLSQPTVSSHIRDLEDYFGCRLIDRLARAAVPTKAGELLYEYARRLLTLRDETETAIAEFQGKIKGCLHIGGSTIPGGYILPAIIGDFKKKYPDVSLVLRIGDTSQIIQEIITGNIEIGIVGAKSTDPNIIQQRLFEDELFVTVPTSHRWAKRQQIEPEKLTREPFIVREAGSGTRKSIQISLAKIDKSLNDFNIVAEMGSNQAMINGVKHDLGVSILSGIAVAAEVAQQRIQVLTIKGLRLKRSFYMTMRHKRTLSPQAAVFIEFLKNSSTMSVPHLKQDVATTL
jgi:DNA-binding transcriptional LysR family regulator